MAEKTSKFKELRDPNVKGMISSVSVVVLGETLMYFADVINENYIPYVANTVGVLVLVGGGVGALWNLNSYLHPYDRD